MPLDTSGSKASIGNNIKAETGAGKKRSQAIAIALSVARKSGRKVAPKPKKPATGFKPY